MWRLILYSMERDDTRFDVSYQVPEIAIGGTAKSKCLRPAWKSRSRQNSCGSDHVWFTMHEDSEKLKACFRVVASTTC